ncbi:hypothetical protein GCM10008905_02710 [Clostridium malenominatum]|uniref:Uncharacterized protein n=1 Tax=Clostridium malenominatum TaxID=1539 RepID=A0ABP3TWY3_9CLOT
MKTTVNYGLKKPYGTDVVNIDDFNYNSDIIDQKLKEVDTKASNITVPVTSVNTKTGAVILSAGDIKASDGKTLEAYKTEVTSELAQMVSRFSKELKATGINDVDMATVTGAYYAMPSVKLPSGVQDGSLFVQSYDTTWVTQLLIDWRTNIQYTRVKTQNVWGTWKKLLTNIDYDQLFQYANNGKTSIANVVGEVTGSNTFSEITDQIWRCKDLISKNLGSKGISASVNETLGVLSYKVGQIEIFSVMAGDTVLASSNIWRDISYTRTPTPCSNNFTVKFSGVIRFKFRVHAGNYASDAYGIIYKNGVATGYSGSASASINDYSYDIPCKKGDVFVLMGYTSSSSNTGTCGNASVCIDLSNLLTISG